MRRPHEVDASVPDTHAHQREASVHDNLRGSEYPTSDNLDKESIQERVMKLKDKFSRANGSVPIEKTAIITRGEQAVDMINTIHNQVSRTKKDTRDELLPKTEAIRKANMLRRYLFKGAAAPFTMAPNRSSNRSIANGMNVVKQPTKIAPMKSMSTTASITKVGSSTMTMVSGLSKIAYFNHGMLGAGIGAGIGGTYNAARNPDNDRLKSFGKGALVGGVYGSALGLLRKHSRVGNSARKKRVDDMNDMFDESEKSQAEFNKKHSWTKGNYDESFNNAKAKYDQKTRGQQQGRASRSKFIDPNAPKPDSFHLSNLRMNKDKFTTKAQVKKHYMDIVRKNHPDRGGSTNYIAKVNSSMDELKKSDWYTKLAFLNMHGNSWENLSKGYTK